MSALEGFHSDMVIIVRLPVIGDLPLASVTPAMLTKLLLDFQKTGKSHGSCIKLYNILNGVFDMAFMDDSIPFNPLSKVKRPKPRRDEQIIDEASKALSVSELAHVLACVENEPLRWRVYITLAADMGARKGELCGLQWADINWKDSTITIRRNLQYTPAKGVYETTTKTGVVRVVDVGPDSIKLLRELRADQATKCISKWVFSQECSPEPMHPQRPTAYFKKFGERCRILKMISQTQNLWHMYPQPLMHIRPSILCLYRRGTREKKKRPPAGRSPIQKIWLSLPCRRPLK